MRRRRLGVLATFCTVAALAFGVAPADPVAQASAARTASTATAAAALNAVPTATRVSGNQPNIVLITADDMRADDLALMPRTKRLLGRAGVTFTDAISNYPLCCPARATLLTGQYSHNNGVQGNEWPYGGHRVFHESGAELETLPLWLQRAGYSTGFIGKYLNYYGTDRARQYSTGPRYIPPGWNDWHASVGRVFQYYCVRLNDNGKLNRYPNQYQTDLYTDLTEDFIDKRARRRKPFFLWTSHLAPHVGVTPSADAPCKGGPGLPTPAAKRHEAMFDGMPLPASPARNEADMSDKGTYMRDRHELDVRHLAKGHQGRLQALQSLDESVAATVSALERKGVLDETLIIFTSDNGWLLGEHRAHKKTLPYEESLRVPMLMRGPGLPSGVRRHQPVGLVDIPATAVAASGATATKSQDGVSLLQLARDPSRLSRRVMPIEAGPAPGVQRKYNELIPPWYYRGIRSSQYSYIAWEMTTGIEEEFYDLDQDPFQLQSRHNSTAPALRASRLMYHQLRDCAGRACVQEMPAGIENKVPAGPRVDRIAPRIRNVSAPSGWIRRSRATVRYTVTDRTDPERKLSHWCSHQARDCDGRATLRLRGDGVHSWTIHVTDRAGNVGSRYGQVGVDLHPPRVRRRGPRNDVVQAPRARLRLAVTDDGIGVAGVDTRIRTAELAGGFTGWKYPARLQDVARPARRVAVRAGGGTVCVQVRARDKIGRETPWRSQVCRARAIDAAGLTQTPQWRTRKRSTWYAGTATTTRARGAALEVPSAGGVSLVRLVARTGPDMGAIRIRVGGRSVARVNLARPQRGLHEFLIPTPGRSGRVRARVVTSGRTVSVDSLGVLRRPGR